MTPCALHFFTVQRVGQLDQDASAVSHQLVSPDRTPVVQVFQDFQCVFDDGMALLAPDMGHKADTTGIVLLLGGIQTVFLQIFDFGSRGHGVFLKICGTDRRKATLCPQLIGGWQ